MEIVLRTVGIYLVLLLFFRLLGKRSLSELSSFDFILFLIISEAIQNALVDDDRSVVMGLTVILTFLMLDMGLSYLKKKYKKFEKFAEGTPLILVDHGKVIEENMTKSRVTDADLLQTARENQGLERISQIKYAVLETSGSISIIPYDPNLEEKIKAVEEKLNAILSRLPDDKGTASH